MYKYTVALGVVSYLAYLLYYGNKKTYIWVVWIGQASPKVEDRKSFSGIHKDSASLEKW